MQVRTIEDGFDYQMHEIFKGILLEIYEDEQADRVANEKEIQPYSEWLWENKDELGKAVFEAYDSYAGIDEETEKYNSKVTV